MAENRWEGFDITGKKKANSSKVSSDISREDISATAKKPTGVLDYKGDITGFLKDGKSINVLDTWYPNLQEQMMSNPVIQTKYIPSGVVVKSINRSLHRTYIDPAKAYKKYTFHVSVAEAKKYGSPVRVPKIEKFRDEHDTDKTVTYWATDCMHTTWFDEDMYCGYDTITVWVYVVNIIPNLGVADSMAYLSMFNDVIDTMQSRLDDGCPLYKYSIPGGEVTSLDMTPYYIIDDTMIFYDERIYKKFMATVARYSKLTK